MLIEAVLIVSAFLAGRWTAPEQLVTTQVKTGVAVECRETVPERPVMPTELIARQKTPPLVDQWTHAARAELKRREAYELELRAALVKCTDPLPAEGSP